MINIKVVSYIMNETIGFYIFRMNYKLADSSGSEGLSAPLYIHPALLSLGEYLHVRFTCFPLPLIPKTSVHCINHTSLSLIFPNTPLELSLDTFLFTL